MASEFSIRLRPNLLQNFQHITTRRCLSQSVLFRQAKAYYASASSSSSSAKKPIILEQPDAFRPPSHPARIRRRRPRMVYGRDLTQDDREDMESKQYPYAMPGKNTFMYKFMHARYFHAAFSLSILTSLVILMFILDFHKNNRHPDLLPHSSLFFRQPVTYLAQYYNVWRLNQADADREHREKRDQRAQDVEGRRRFREHHDLPEVTGLTQWLGMGTKEEEERLARKRQREMDEQQQQQQQQSNAVSGDASAAIVQDDSQRETVINAAAGREGERPKRKVFLGIWGW